MVKFAEGPTVEVSIDIEAPPARVWELVTDINLPAKFQSEFVGGEWLDEPGAVGSRFLGRNERRDASWETTSWVVEHVPEKAFGWAVSDPDQPGAVWTYRLEPTDDGTRLVYHRRLGPGSSGLTGYIEKYPEREEEIIAARDAEHTANMEAVLEGIKVLAEAD